jgi:hypothetical protein
MTLDTEPDCPLVSHIARPHPALQRNRVAETRLPRRDQKRPHLARMVGAGPGWATGRATLSVRRVRNGKEPPPPGLSSVYYAAVPRRISRPIIPLLALAACLSSPSKSASLLQTCGALHTI